MRYDGSKGSEMTLNCINSKSIPNGTKFVAIYGDGSGARLFCIDDSGSLWDSESRPNHITTAPDIWLMDAGFMYWMKLPDTFKLCFENQKEKHV